MTIRNAVDGDRREVVSRFALPLGLIVVALTVRAAFVSTISSPVSESATYYVNVARALADGRGLVSDSIWSYLTPPLVLPRPAFELWLPLPSLLAAIPMALFGTTLVAAQAVAVAAGLAVTLITWRLGAAAAREVGADPIRRWIVAAGAGLAAALGAPFVLQSGLPDSTMLFGALALAAVSLMAAELRVAHWSTRRLVGIGVLVGAAALTRSEAIWLLATWVGTVVIAGRRGRTVLRPTLVVSVVAAAIYLPWAVRGLVVFGSPLPAGAMANALFTSPTDLFAYADPPTLERYLAQGWPTILAQHVEGIRHDLVDVLLLPSFPIGAIGLVALPWSLRKASWLRPLGSFAILTFLATSLLFPVATLNGTYLHNAVPAQALLAISAALALDGLIERVSRWRRWRRSMAWTGLAAIAVWCAIALPTLAVVSEASAAAEVRDRALANLLPTDLRDRRAGPVITDAPFTLSAAIGVQTLALPNEPIDSIVALARRFGARYVVVLRNPTAAFAAGTAGGGAEACLAEVPRGDSETEAVGVSVWRITCR